MNHPKFSYELEQRVLENLMDLERASNLRVQEAMLRLTPNCFYKPEHASLFALIAESFEAEESFGFVDILVKLGQGNNQLHMALQRMVEDYRSMHVSNRSLETDVTKLITLRNLRDQIKLTRQMLEEVAECPDPLEAQAILTEQSKQIAAYSHMESKHGIYNTEIASQFYDGMLCEEQKIATNCMQLNAALGGGIMPRSLIIVAAGASVGKTGFSIFLMDAIARQQPETQCLFFSIEMLYRHIWSRHVGICAGKPFDQLTDDEKISAIATSSQVPTKIYDAASCPKVADLDFILTTARLEAMKRPISVIVVDYLGLVRNSGQFERNDLRQSDITSKLAELAIQLNCTVIALSQINRGNAARAIDDRCPWPHDAADSSGGHRSASLWLGVDRPELYQADPSYQNQFVVKCRKNRFGDIFDLTLAFNGGTFAEVKPGTFRKPISSKRTPEEQLFSPQGCDIYAN